MKEKTGAVVTVEKGSIMDGGMSWKEMAEIVARQIDRLAMCKRGTLATDIQKLQEKHGKCPSYTKEERNEIKESLAAKVKKAMTPTLAECKKYAPDDMMYKLRERALKVTEDAYIHPGAKKWKEDLEKIKLQGREREAQLEGDVQDIKDQFLLGINRIEDFPAIRDKFEATEW